ncbi:hypothetical protein NQ317_016323 [Molorchus minor]|uniref:Tc1-like transposase DDE domain-containing protein n=1 Tax=Molorchus minor TaxID=1323400 RepID=A0ABQ9J337_9CUCU|nr:hypothetical protein NQ317_016323 [Molorchus minor]
MQLLKIAQREKSRFTKYVVEEMTKARDVTILRLPPYHCELNPIELIWAQIKTDVARNNRTFKLGDVKLLLNDAASPRTHGPSAFCTEIIWIQRSHLCVACYSYAPLIQNTTKPYFGKLLTFHHVCFDRILSLAGAFITFCFVHVELNLQQTLGQALLGE